ncbi:MAG: hypothetical protein EOP51_15155 [Sphingobacteriales bacterium]|nr:MAG: hypothetical protein EOP51_15155 [Sphingobacteriales bacterium]
MKQLIVILNLVMLPILVLAQDQQQVQPNLNSVVLLHPVTKDQYSNNLSFFCRKELQLEKAIKMPVKIRVGSIEQCNYLEQKPGYMLPNK